MLLFTDFFSDPVSDPKHVLQFWIGSGPAKSFGSFWSGSSSQHCSAGLSEVGNIGNVTLTAYAWLSEGKNFGSGTVTVSAGLSEVGNILVTLHWLLTASAWISEVRNIGSGTITEHWMPPPGFQRWGISVPVRLRNTGCLCLDFRGEEYRFRYDYGTLDASAWLSEVRNIGSGTMTVSACLSEVRNISSSTLNVSLNCPSLRSGKLRGQKSPGPLKNPLKWPIK